MTPIVSIVNVGDSIWRLVKERDNNITISSDIIQKEVPSDIFFQLAALCIHASKELDYVKTYYPGISIVLREDTIEEISLAIKYDGINSIKVLANGLIIYMDQHQFLTMIDDLYNAMNNLVSRLDFDARNYDPAFLNVMLAKELPYFCGEKIVDMYLDELLVPHVPYQPGVPETVSLNECVRVNSLRGNVDIDFFNRRGSNHYKQSNSMRLNSVLDMVIKRGYPYNNEYITIFSTCNLVVDGWHRASCLYYLYGNIRVPVKVIVLNK